jgi:hypothetical protein
MSKYIEWKDMGLREKLFAIKMWGEVAVTCKYDPSKDVIVEKYGIAFKVRQEGAEVHKELIQRGWKESELQELIGHVHKA